MGAARLPVDAITEALTSHVTLKIQKFYRWIAIQKNTNSNLNYIILTFQAFLSTPLVQNKYF